VTKRTSPKAIPNIKQFRTTLNQASHCLTSRANCSSSSISGDFPILLFSWLLRERNATLTCEIGKDGAPTGPTIRLLPIAIYAKFHDEEIQYQYLVYRYAIRFNCLLSMETQSFQLNLYIFWRFGFCSTKLGMYKEAVFSYS